MVCHFLYIVGFHLVLSLRRSVRLVRTGLLGEASEDGHLRQAVSDEPEVKGAIDDSLLEAKDASHDDSEDGRHEGECHHDRVGQQFATAADILATLLVLCGPKFVPPGAFVGALCREENP